MTTKLFALGAVFYGWRAYRRRRRVEAMQRWMAQLLADLADAQREAEDRLIADNLDI